MPRFAAVALLSLLLTAGCAGVPGGPSPTPPTASTASNTVVCDGVSVAFWRLREPRGWASDTLRVGYQLPADANVLLVARVDGVVRGGNHVTADRAVAADGDRVGLNRSFSGVHTVSVTVHRDANENGEFDPGTDPACRNGGKIVRAGPERIDFDRFD